MVSTSTDGELSKPYQHGQHDSILIKLPITSGMSQLLRSTEFSCLPPLAALYGLHVVVDVLDTTPKSLQPSVSFTVFEGKGRTA